MQKTFTVGQAIGYGFNTIFDNFKLFFLSFLAIIGTYLSFFVAFLLLLALIVVTTTSITFIDFFCGQATSIALIATLPIPIFLVILFGICFFLYLICGLKVGLIQLVFNVHDKTESSVADIFSRFYLAPRLVGTALIFGLIVVGGLVLLIIPGIYWALRFSLFPYFIVDQETGIIDSLKKSYAITQGNVWQLLGVYIIIMLVAVVPLIGAFTSFLLVPIASVYIYRKLALQPIIPPAIPL